MAYSAFPLGLTMASQDQISQLSLKSVFPPPHKFTHPRTLTDISQVTIRGEPW